MDDEDENQPVSGPSKEEKDDLKPLNTRDIPGSDLDLSMLSSYRVEELKCWLSCRGDSLKSLPTKATCIQR